MSDADAAYQQGYDRGIKFSQEHLAPQWQTGEPPEAGVYLVFRRWNSDPDKGPRELSSWNGECWSPSFGVMAWATILDPPSFPAFCRHPESCLGRGSCPRDPACND